MASRIVRGIQLALLGLALSLVGCGGEDPRPKERSVSDVKIAPPECRGDADCPGGACSLGKCLVCESVDFDFDSRAEAIPAESSLARAYAPELLIEARANLGAPRHSSLVPTAHDAESRGEAALFFPGRGNVLVSEERHGHDPHGSRPRSGSVLEFSFDDAICAKSVDMLNLARRSAASVSLFDSRRRLIKKIDASSEREQTLDLGTTCNVYRIAVTLPQDGALDELRVCGARAPLDRCSRVAPHGAEPVFQPVSGDNRRLTLTALSDAPDPFSPNGDTVNDQTTLTGTAAVASARSSHGSRFTIAYEYRIVDARTCAPVRTLRDEVDARRGTPASLVAVWDGFDRRQRLVPDGRYLYRLTASLLGRDGHRHGNVEIDRARTRFQSVIKDNAPLAIIVENPDLTGPVGAQFVDWEARTQGTALALRGRLSSPRDLRAFDVALNGASVPFSLDALGGFSANLMLNVAGPGPVVDNGVTIRATDVLGQVATSSFVVHVRIDDVVAGRLRVRFKPEATEAASLAAVAAVGASISHRNRAAREAVLSLSPSLDVRAAAVALAGDPAVAYAAPSFLGKNFGLCDTNPATNDPQRNTTGQYYLGNSGDYVAFDYSDSGLGPDPQPIKRCQTALECRGAQDECVLGVCVLGSSGVSQFNGSASATCSTNSDCTAVFGAASHCSDARKCRYPDTLAGTPCTTNDECSFLGRGASCQSTRICVDPLGYDTPSTCTDDASCVAEFGAGAVCSAARLFCFSPGSVSETSCNVDNDCASVTGSTCVTAGLCGKRSRAGADLGWQDVSAAVCDVAANGPEVIVGLIEGLGIANLSHRDLQTRMWTNFLECRAPACTLDAQCGAGGRCVEGRMCDGSDADLLPDCVPGNASPGDSCPGTCGDDDGDGYADLDDRDVQRLLERLNTNCLDDDGDFAVDDGRPALAALGTAETACGDCVDDDIDGVKDDGCPARAVVGTAESALVQEDDDEDGYIDDFHGFNFNRAFAEGARDMNGAVVGPEGERQGSTLPSFIASLTDNDSHATLVASSTASQLDNGLELAGINPRVRLMTLSSGFDLHYVEAARYAEAHGARVVSMSWGTTFGFDPSQQTFDTYKSQVMALERTFLDALSPSMLYFMAAGNERFDWAALAPYDPGTNTCTFLSCLWSFPQSVHVYLDIDGNPVAPPFGTSLSASIGGVDMSDRFIHQFLGDFVRGSNFGPSVDFASPTDTVDILLSTGTTGVERTGGGTSFASPTAAGVASLVIARIPDLDRRPAKLLARLRSTLEPCQAPMSGQRGCETLESPGRIDLANALNRQPLPSLNTWENETWRLNDMAMDNTNDIHFMALSPGGQPELMLEIFGGVSLEQAQPKIHLFDRTSETFRDVSVARLQSNLTGNYNKADFADLNGDNCNDFVLGGFVQPDSGTAGLRGERNRLVLQNKPGSTCLGTFREATDEMVGGVVRLPTRDDITRDVDLFDMDGNGTIDILFTNATFPAPGGNLGDQLFRNDGNGVFTDVSSQLDANITGDAHRASSTCFIDAGTSPDVVQAVNGTNRILINDGTGRFTDETLARGLPANTGFSHDVECFDFFLPDGSLGQDGHPELVFARRFADDLSGLTDLMYLNDGTGHFTDISTRLGPFSDDTQSIEICELDGTAPPEIIVGNGDALRFSSLKNRVLRWNPTTNAFVDASTDLGFLFGDFPDLTEEIRCGDLVGNDGVVDTIVIANTGQRNWLYRRRR